MHDLLPTGVFAFGDRRCCSQGFIFMLPAAVAAPVLQATAGSLQSLCWGSSAVGGIVSAYFSGSLVEQYGSQTVFCLTAIFPLIVSASALLIDEQRVTKQQRPAAAAAGADAGESQPLKQQQGLLQQPQVQRGSGSGSWSSGLVQQMVQQGGALWGAVKQKHILLPTVFVFLWQVGGCCDMVRTTIACWQSTSTQTDMHSCAGVTCLSGQHSAVLWSSILSMEQAILRILRVMLNFSVHKLSQCTCLAGHSNS